MNSTSNVIRVIPAGFSWLLIVTSGTPDLGIADDIPIFHGDTGSSDKYFDL